MEVNKKNAFNFSGRENVLVYFLNKLMKEYKALLAFSRRSKPLKIVEIIEPSDIPGETRFVIQITNKNSIISLSAGDIITQGYNLNDFNDFHAEMIKQALAGKLIDFLSVTTRKPNYKIVSKKYVHELQEFIFTIETHENQTLNRTSNEIANDKKMLGNMDLRDVFDVGYTKGSESILKEKLAILLAK